MLTLLNPYRHPTPIVVPVVEDWVIDIDPVQNHSIPRSSFGDVAGAFLLCIQSMRGFDPIAPSGFTSIIGAWSGGNIGLRISYQFSSAPGGNISVIDFGNDSIVAIFRLSGVHPGSPIAANNHTVATTSSPIAPSVTTPENDALVFSILAADDGDITIDAGYPAGYDGYFLRNTPPSADCSLGVATKLQGSAGATGTAAWSLTASEETVAATVAIAAQSPTP